MAVRAGLTPFAESSFSPPNTGSLYNTPYSMPSSGADSNLSSYLEQANAIASTPSLQQQTAPAEQQQGRVYVNSNSNQYFVNGLMFDIDDHTQAVESEQYLNLPEMRVPEGDGWQEIDRNSFQGFIDKIKDPSLGTQYAKNLGIGVDILQDLGGNALQLVGDTLGADWLADIGEGIADQQTIDIDKKSIYQKQFTDIDNGGDAVNWFVGVLGQQTPIIAEVIASFAAGYALGGFHPVSGGAVGLGAAGLTLLKSLGTKKVVTPFIRKGLKKEFDEAFTAGIKAQKSGKKFSTLSPLHQKRIRQATGITAVFANNYAFGMGDLYGELKGADPENAIWKSWVLAYPYAMAETMPEMLLAGRFLGGIRGEGGVLRRLATGLTVGGIAEGGVEAFQESLLLSSNPEIDLTSPEGFNRLVNSFAAGAAIGMPIGGAANVIAGKSEDVALSGEEIDLLNKNVTETRKWSQRTLEEVGQRISDIKDELALLSEPTDYEQGKGTRAIRTARFDRELAVMEAIRKQQAAARKVSA